MLTRKKTTRAEHKKVSEKEKKEAFRIKGALSNAKQTKNTHNNSHIEEGQRKSPKMNQTAKEPYQQKTKKNKIGEEQSPTKC